MYYSLSSLKIIDYDGFFKCFMLLNDSFINYLAITYFSNAQKSINKSALSIKLINTLAIMKSKEYNNQNKPSLLFP